METKMTDLKPGDRVKITGDRPTGGKTGSIVMWGFVPDWVLVKLDQRFKTRHNYMYHINELEFVATCETEKLATDQRYAQ
jgi:hypothetical protein